MVERKTGKLMFFALGALALAATNPAAQQQGTPIADDAFYQPPDENWAVEERGALLKQEAEDKFSGDLMNNASVAYRIMFRGEGALGQPIVATGTVFVPDGDEPAEGWNIIAWLPCTQGIGDDCASSNWPGLYHTNWEGYTKPVKKILERGVLAVQVDYEGLGTDEEGVGYLGLHTYQVSEAARKVSIDAVKAARQLGHGTTGVFGVVGHSQGGFAARAVNVLATEETLRDLTFVGDVEGGHAFRR